MCRPRVFIVVLGVAFAVACAAESPTALPEQPAPALEVRQLEVIAEPRDAADFLLNPKPVGAGDYISGITVTIDVLAKDGWEIKEWVGPVYDTAGNTAKITMDSTQVVVVRFVRTTAAGASNSAATKLPASTAIVVVASSLAATADPTEIPNPRRTLITAAPTSRFPTIPPIAFMAAPPTPKPTSRPTPGPTPTLRPTPVPSPAPGGQQILFQDDFERGNASNWQSLNKGFTVVQDETGNYVLQGSTLEGYTFEGTAKVGELTWRDYALEFRGRVLKNASPSTWDLVVRVRARPSCNRYTIWFRAGESDGAKIIQQRTGGAECEIRSQSAASQVSLELNRWYLFRIEAVGPMITVDLDGRQILELRDSRPLLSGGITFSVKKGGTVQFDDIRVVNLTVQP